MIFLRMLSLLGVLLVSAVAAYPCTCSQVTHRKEYRQADAIFAGKVIEISEDKSFVPPKLNDPALSPETLARLQRMVDTRKSYIVRLQVEKKHKGRVGEKTILYTLQSDSPCSGIAFVEGERYLIYAKRHKDGFAAGELCSRTSKLDPLTKEYRELNSVWFRFKSGLPF